MAEPEDDDFYKAGTSVPAHIEKYWKQRHTIFSQYAEGVVIPEGSWCQVTPEPIANTIAEELAESTPSQKKTLIDPFAGVGGNVIAFARTGRWNRIFAIEKDPEILRCAKKNAEIYGVSNQIWWIQGDCFKVLKSRFKDIGEDTVIFASPPWGGPEYAKDPIFDLNRMKPYNLPKLHKAFTSITRDVVLYLPRTSDLNQVAAYGAPDRKLTVSHCAMWGYSKALCVYFGSLAPGIKQLDELNKELSTGCPNPETSIDLPTHESSASLQHCESSNSLQSLESSASSESLKSSGSLPTFKSAADSPSFMSFLRASRRKWLRESVAQWEKKKFERETGMKFKASRRRRGGYASKIERRLSA